MTRRLILAMAAVVGLVAIALAIPLAITTSNAERSRFIADLEIQTLSAASLLASQSPDVWPASVDTIAQRTGARVVVVDANGQLVADSEDSALGRPFQRPEVDAALTGQLVVDVRPSATVGSDLRLVAAPVVQDMSVVAAVRLSLLEDTVNAEVRRTQLWLALFVLAVIAGVVAIAWLIAKSIGTPLEDLSRVARDLPDDLALRADEHRGPGEVRDVAVALNDTAARLDGMLQRTRRVAADASHHLRTPLTGVRLRLEAIEDMTEQDDVRTEAMAATSEVDRLTRRIEQVLDLARTDAGSERGQQVNASIAVAERCDAAAVIAEERGLELDVDVMPDVQAAMSAGAVARVVDELLGNAFTYARSRVRVVLTADGDEGLLVVEDDGPGVDDTEREAIFTRFTRGTQSVPGGSGLGLALVRETVRSVGGDASATASASGGLRVEVRLPLARR